MSYNTTKPKKKNPAFKLDIDNHFSANLKEPLLASPTNYMDYAKNCRQKLQQVSTQNIGLNSNIISHSQYMNQGNEKMVEKTQNTISAAMSAIDAEIKKIAEALQALKDMVISSDEDSQLRN